jgi:antitoxin ParD1/3/4
MSIEQMNISLSSQMARFIRGKVKKGEYTNSSEVVRDAVRRMQEEEAIKKERALLADFESGLTKAEREGIRRGVRQGIKDIETGRYEEYDADGLRALTKKLVAASARKLSGHRKAR